MNSSSTLQRLRAMPGRVWFTLTISAPLWLILVISVAVGLLIGVLLRTRRKS